MVKVPIWAILYYLQVADLMGITSSYPRENIIAGNYILADTQEFLDKRHRQQNNEILIRHLPEIGECFFVFKYSIRACIYALHLLNMCKDIF